MPNKFSSAAGTCGFALASKGSRSSRCDFAKCCLRVAVVGGGLAGLSVADRLCKLGVGEVVLFDPNPIGVGNASAVAAGMLHKFTPRGKKAFMADEAFQRSQEMISESAPNSIIYHGALFRAAVTEKQEKDYIKASQLNPDSELLLLQGDEVQCSVPQSPARMGLLIRDAFIIDTKMYMKELWNKCVSTGAASHRLERVKSPADLFDSGFDSVVIAAGYQSNDLVPQHMNMQRKQGRNVIFRKRSSGSVFNIPMVSGKYLVPQRDNDLLAGATVEAVDPNVNERGISETLEALGTRIFELYPDLEEHYEPASVTSGVRGIPIRPPGIAPLPYLSSPSPNVWLIAGLASRGLLHHALLADLLTNALVSNDPSLLPEELQSGID
uniref:FAD dependent oxidoreductase domain-containing protein n=1 Tax=Rhodosorus marinus TaxID=101924 RepID=A0A7S3EJF9_9RHOD|mmetsp:Transcript_37426/g.149322  ORF Transcript_37426/g.149322 Transcript_37426/m.149322 type:complete len:382 (+) Transcript_37426:192-1337(+)